MAKNAGLCISAARACLVAIAAIADGGMALAHTRAPPFVAPPRTIADITSILDQERPASEELAKRHAAADAPSPPGVNRTQLEKFYYERAQARAALARHDEAIVDARKAIELGGNPTSEHTWRLRQFLIVQHSLIGDPKTALKMTLSMASEYDHRGMRGRLFDIYRSIGAFNIVMGDVNQAEAILAKSQALLVEARAWPNAYRHLSAWQSHYEVLRGHVLEARGRYREGEMAYNKGHVAYRSAIAKTLASGTVTPRSHFELLLDRIAVASGRTKARQGRYAEAEADIRKVLLNRLKWAGKYNAEAAGFVVALANVLAEQARYQEAAKLIRTAIDIYRTIGISESSQRLASALNELGSVLNLDGRWSEAMEAYTALGLATKDWEPTRREGLMLNIGRIFTLYNNNNLAAGIAAAERLFAWQKSRFGDQHVETAGARGMLAVGFARAGRDPDALREFKLAIPILMSASRETDVDDTIGAAAREQRTQIIIEAYIALLARIRRTPEAEPTALETFQLAEAIRGRAVQKALAASSARMGIRDPALAELARSEQDLEKQLVAQLGLLNHVLASPPEQRNEKAIGELNLQVEKLRAARNAARKDIERRFLKYAELKDPKRASLDDVRAALRPDEAFLSFYFGREMSFVWAVPRVGATTFLALPLTAEDVEDKVLRLRKAFEPEGDLLSDIPRFDVALAHALYSELLEPVENVWGPAKSLIVVTNGALAQLPLGLLPTKPQPAEDDPNGKLFASYRNVDWLVRSHAVTMVPSAASLLALRQLPLGSSKREILIGFGDPYFSKEQAAEAKASITLAALDTAAKSEGLPVRRRAFVQFAGVDSAELSRLPRLADTADELRSVAMALSADPAKVLHLGKDANEKNVKETDLSKFRIIAFATHGLMPGDLNGLTQPALALTAPSVADVDGDGLLTMEEVLALKLDADWVVLSACNTGAGAGAGAEAVSGLGRAFFYAGTRTLLVTNWAVHSASARDLVVDLFRRYAGASKLTRAQALRQAMLALIDGGSFTGKDGKTVFSYAHPLFWAPYSLVGDGAGSLR